LLNEDYYEILAKKLDDSVPRLSPYGDKGNIPKGWITYLKLLINPEDIKYLIKLSVNPNSITLKRYAKKMGKTEEEASQILERLVGQNCVLKIGTKDPKYAIHQTFLLHSFPPLSYDKYPEEVAKELAELSYKNLVEGEWYKVYSGSPNTPLLRVIPVQESIESEKMILPNEDLLKILDKARIIAIAKCACKTRMDVLGIRECKDTYPLETCFYMNHMAKFIIERGLGREISKEEAKKLTKEFNKKGLIHTIENFGEGMHFMLCNCCSCCCNPLGGMIKWDKPHSVASSNYIAVVKDLEGCEKCETCIENCAFGAISMSENGPTINKENCMGCGICVVNCPSNIIKLEPLERNQMSNSFLELGFKIGREMD